MCSNYLTLLLRISDHITDANLEKLKFLCSDAIEERELKDISSPLKLFKALQRRELLSIDNLSFLRELLSSVHCSQLVNEVDDFIERRHLELLALDRLCRKGKQQIPCSRYSPKAEPCFRETGSAEACCFSCQCSQNSLFEQREPGDIHLKIVLKLATVGAWVAGTAFILKRYINDPETLVKLFNTVVLPSGVLVKCICEGSIVCILKANNLHGLRTLWKNYESGLLRKALEDILITEDLCKLAEDHEITLEVILDQGMYRDVCLELLMVMEKDYLVDSVYREVEYRSRSLSDPTISQRVKRESTFQEDSFRIMANTERRRRLEVEKKLEKRICGQQLELHFPELLPLYTGKDILDVGDDSSSTTSTWDEEEVLDWEDDNDPSKEFWSSIPGGLKEKPWTNFEDAINREFPDNLRRGGPPLLKFLAYVLRVNYDQRGSQNVSLRSFIRMSRWFGPLNKGSQSNCLRKMSDLMEHSVSVGSDGKITSWFAGYLTEEEAKQKLRDETAGTFLIRFSTSMVAPGFVLSKKSGRNNDVAEFNIEVHKNTGHVEFGDRIFRSLPALVMELRNSWMTDLQPFHSAAGIPGVETSQEKE